MATVKFDARGRELPDPRPIEIPADCVRPESLQSMMQRMIRDHLSRHADEAGEDSFEEANDFEVEDDEWDDTLTKYEEMASEPDTRAEVEEFDASALDASTSEPTGLRSGDTGPTGRASGPETGDADSDAGVNPDSPNAAAARAANVVVQQPRATIQRRRGNAAS